MKVQFGGGAVSIEKCPSRQQELRNIIDSFIVDKLSWDETSAKCKHQMGSINKSQIRPRQHHLPAPAVTRNFVSNKSWKFISLSKRLTCKLVWLDNDTCNTVVSLLVDIYSCQSNNENFPNF